VNKQDTSRNIIVNLTILNDCNPAKKISNSCMRVCIIARLLHHLDDKNASQNRMGNCEHGMLY